MFGCMAAWSMVTLAIRLDEHFESQQERRNGNRLANDVATRVSLTNDWSGYEHKP
jgi:hypothetical protein